MTKGKFQGLLGPEYSGCDWSNPIQGHLNWISLENLSVYEHPPERSALISYGPLSPERIAHTDRMVLSKRIALTEQMALNEWMALTERMALTEQMALTPEQMCLTPEQMALTPKWMALTPERIALTSKH